MRFDDYHISPVLKKNLSELGFKRPTDIQYKSIPSILKREDVLAIAQTGTGKTAAFAIPVTDILIKKKQKRSTQGIMCIVMVPTRELAKQIESVFNDLIKDTGISCFALFGGVEQDKQIERLQNNIDILIATPGRMFDLISQGHLDVDNVEILILDEADHMLDLGFIKDIRDIKRKLTHRHQTLFFSATINKEIKKIAYSLVKNAIRIQISPKDPVSKNVVHSVVHVKMDDKRFFLEYIIKENPDSKVLVFVRTKVRAERVKKAMERAGVESLAIHGDKEQKERFEIMEQFRSGKVRVLIATDVSARGIDIPNVNYVVNYDLPEQPENYVHRVGRTGRGNEKGFAVSFCSDEEKELLEQIEETVNGKIPVEEVSKREYKNILNFTGEDEFDWKSLIEENEEFLKTHKKKKKGKK